MTSHNDEISGWDSLSQHEETRGNGNSAFFSQNSVLRVNFSHMKDVSIHELFFFAMQKTDFHVLELFCRASYVRAHIFRK